MKVTAVIQARVGSSRLPGKVLQPLAGEPMLARVVARVARAMQVHTVIVATSILPKDDEVETLCRTRGILCFRGSEADVLDRFYGTAKAFPSDVIVRITADCPFISPEIIDELVALHLGRKADYTSNTLPPRTFPRGLDAEIVNFTALERAWREDRNPGYREHVTPYIYRNPGKFRLVALTSPTDFSSERWTVDTPEDLQVCRRVYDYFGHDRFHWKEVLQLSATHPDWFLENRQVVQKELAR